MTRWIYALLLAVVTTGAHAFSPCLDRPIRFSHYEFGLLYSEGYGGIDDDIQSELARRSGCAFTVDLRPRARIWFELDAGTLDMAGSGVQTPARDEFAWFEHYVLEDNLVHLGPNVPASVNSMEAFLASPELTIGGVRSFSFSPYYDQQVKQLMDAHRYNSVTDTRQLFRMFDKGRYDLFIASQLLSLHYFKVLKLPAPARIADWDPGPATPSGLVISKKTFTPEQGAYWQKLISAMIADGTVRTILVRHMGEGPALKAEYRKPERTR